MTNLSRASAGQYVVGRTPGRAALPSGPQHLQSPTEPRLTIVERNMQIRSNYTETMSPYALRDVLVTHRRAAGLTQEGLSERSGVSVRTIRNLEAGVIATPRLSSIQLLLEALNVQTPPSPPMLGPRLQGTPDHNRLIGRDRDMQQVERAVHQSRVVVLTGPGGVGKTRLASEFADGAFEAFQYGVLFAWVGALAADHPEDGANDGVKKAITAALDEFVPDSCALASSISYSGSQPSQVGDLLVVIDNAEHVLRSAAKAIRWLTSEMPRVHVLVTSRRPLPAMFAHHWEVKPLPHDFPPGQSGSVPAAIELFLQRAQASCPTLDLHSDLGSLAQLCRRLDGLPLALELAATRIRAVPMKAMLREESIPRILGQVDFDGLPHQSNLLDSVRWSYDLLTDGQREVLYHLARFPSHFTLQEAQESLGGPTVAIADVLAALVDSSLVQVRRDMDYQYRLTNIVRESISTIREIPG